MHRLVKTGVRKCRRFSNSCIVGLHTRDTLALAVVISATWGWGIHVYLLCTTVDESLHAAGVDRMRRRLVTTRYGCTVLNITYSWRLFVRWRCTGVRFCCIIRSLFAIGHLRLILIRLMSYLLHHINEIFYLA